jgi:hypothetical protein
MTPYIGMIFKTFASHLKSIQRRLLFGVQKS